VFLCWSNLPRWHFGRSRNLNLAGVDHVVPVVWRVVQGRLTSCVCVSFVQMMILACSWPCRSTVTNTTAESITIEFKTGPNPKNSFFEVKCTDGVFGNCTSPDLGVPLNGTLPRKYSLITATVDGLDPATTYNCFVLNYWKKLSKCSTVAGNATTLAAPVVTPPSLPCALSGSSCGVLAQCCQGLTCNSVSYTHLRAHET